MLWPPWKRWLWTCQLPQPKSFKQRDGMSPSFQCLCFGAAFPLPASLYDSVQYPFGLASMLCGYSLLSGGSLWASHTSLQSCLDSTISQELFELRDIQSYINLSIDKLKQVSYKLWAIQSERCSWARGERKRTKHFKTWKYFIEMLKNMPYKRHKLARNW